MPRFFAAVAMAGKFFVQGLSQYGPWNPRALVYWEESDINRIFNERTGDRKARTAEQLAAAVEESRGRTASLRVWVLEGLEDEARRLQGLR